MEFTEEQEAEIQKRILEARNKQAEFEQYRTAGLQFYKEALDHMAREIDQYDPQTKQLIRQGRFDPYVYAAGQNEYQRFLAAYFPQPKPAEPEEEKKPND